MERSSASAGSGLFRCRSGCRPDGRGASLLKWVPIPTAVATKPESPVFPTVSGADVVVYEDFGISGGKGRDNRPALDRMLKDANRRRFDVAMAWSIGGGTVHRVKRELAAVAL
jgi:hypothetical protein